MTRKRNFPPIAVNPNNPQQGEAIDAIVVDSTDDTNEFYFKAELVGNQGNSKRMAIRLTSLLPAGGATDPLDGLLTITLRIAQVVNPLTIAFQQVSDVPVDYISDPNAP